VLATGALVVLAPVIRERLATRLPRWLAEAVSVPAAATIACAPVIVMISGQVSLSSIPANLLAEPAVAPATVLGVVAACTAPIALPVAQLFARLGGVPCSWLIFVARTFSEVPGSTVSWPAGGRGALLLTAVMVVLFVAGAAIRLRRLPGRRTLAALVAGSLVAGGVVSWRARRAVSWPPSSWVFAACDVGQGNAFVVRTGASSAVLVDAGPDPTLIAGCLDQLGIRQLPLVLLTGFAAADTDGLLGAFDGRRVGVVAAATAPPTSAPADRLSATLAAIGAELSSTSVGDHGVLGAVGWQLLGPIRTYNGTGADQENDSLVARFTVAGASILLAGDIAAAAESDLLSAGLATVDVLVGSQQGAQDPRFRTALRPAVVIDGSYSVAITDDDGAVRAVQKLGH
jgi:competence protein ComEC